jgi:hypothetical protein
MNIYTRIQDVKRGRARDRGKGIRDRGKGMGGEKLEQLKPRQALMGIIQLLGEWSNEHLGELPGNIS